MTIKHYAPPRTSPALPWSLWLILAVGGAARLYHLGTPSLWGDEIQAVFGASFPIDYLLRWIMAIEVHPPTYHLILKLFLLVGNDDFILRLPSALAGIASIWLVWRIARDALDQAEGLFAAALLAANPAHIWISRQVRPYAILIFLFCVSYLCLRRVVATPSPATMRRFLLANTPLVLLHLLSLLILGAQGALLASLTLLRRLPARYLATFALASFVTVLPLIPLLHKTLTQRPDVNQIRPLGLVLAATANNMAGLFDFFHTGWLLAAMAGLMALGLARLALQRPLELLPPLAFVLVPVATVLAKGYSSYYFVTHVSYMLPVLLVPIAAGLGWLLRGRMATLAAPILATAMITAACLPQAAKLYDTDSNVISWWSFGTFKTIARESINRFHDHELIVMEDPFLADSVDWYARQYTAVPPYLDQRLGPDNAVACVNLLSLSPDFGDLAPAASNLRSMDVAAKDFRIEALYGLTAVLARSPRIVMGSLPFAATLTAAPTDVFVRAKSLEGLAICSSGGFGLNPLKYDTPGVVEYELINSSGTRPGRLAIGLAYFKSGKGCRIDVAYALDDGPWRSEATSVSSDDRTFTLIQAETPPEGFSKLRLRVSLLAQQKTPYAVSGNLHGLRLNQIFVSLYDAKTEGLASETITTWLKRCILNSHAGIGFLGHSPEQTVTTEEGNALTVRHERPDAETLVQTDPARPARLLVRLPRPKGDIVFFPRVTGAGTVVVRRLEPDGARREVFHLSGLHEVWSDVAARYQIDAGRAPATFEIELSGGAQLWRTDENVFYTP